MRRTCSGYRSSGLSPRSAGEAGTESRDADSQGQVMRAPVRQLRELIERANRAVRRAEIVAVWGAVTLLLLTLAGMLAGFYFAVQGGSR